MDALTIIVVGTLVAVAIFTIFRAIALWYWRVNESIALQHKTIFLLEKVIMQLGSTKLDEITIEEIKTGKIKRVKLDEWVKYNLENPNKKGFRTLSDDTPINL